MRRGVCGACGACGTVCAVCAGPERWVVGGRGVVEECVQGGGGRGERQVERVQCVGTGVVT